MALDANQSPYSKRSSEGHLVLPPHQSVGKDIQAQELKAVTTKVADDLQNQETEEEQNEDPVFTHIQKVGVKKQIKNILTKFK